MKQKENRVYALLFCILFCLAVAFFFDCYFDANDDATLRDILAGRYAGMPSGMAVYILFPLGWLLSLFYWVAPLIPWYGLFLCGCQFGCLYLLTERTLSFFEKKSHKAAVLIVEACMVLSMLLSKLVFVQYTVTAGLLAATAVFLFYTSEAEETPLGFLRRNAISIFLAILAFLLRPQMLLLALPLFCVAGLCRWAKEKPFFTKNNVVKYFSVFGIILGGIIVFQLLHNVAYGSESWREFSRLCDNRTELYDFWAIPSYEGNEEFYESIGMTKSGQMLLENYNFGLDERIDADLLGKVADYAEKLRDEQVTSKDIFQKAFEKYKYRTFHNEDYPYNLFVLALYAMVLATAVINRHFRYLWELCCLGVVRTGLWMYIEYRGRDPERIIHPLYIMEICILSGFLLTEGRELSLKKKNVGKWLQGAFAGVLLLLGAFFIADSVKETKAEYARREELNKEWTAFLQYTEENPDNFYFADVYSTVRYSEKIFQSRYTGVANYDIMGGWINKSPLEKAKLAHFEMTDVATALLSSDSVYLVVQSEENPGLPAFPDWVLAYYAEVGEEITIKIKDSISCEGKDIFTVYQLQKK